MKSVAISGVLRDKVGKTATKSLRKEGKVPCVLYGGKENLHFACEETAFKSVIYTPEVNSVKLTVNGKEYHAMLKDAQFHPVEEQILHADFFEILPEKKIKVGLPVKPVGTSIGVLQGGKLMLLKRKLTVRGYEKDLPEHIDVDITSLNIGQTIRVRDIKSDKWEYTDPQGNLIITVASTRAAVEASAAAGATAAKTPAKK